MGAIQEGDERVCVCVYACVCLCVCVSLRAYVCVLTLPQERLSGMAKSVMCLVAYLL